MIDELASNISKSHSVFALITRQFISYLVVASWLFGCHKDQVLTLRPTDLIARLDEWNVSGPLSNTAIVKLADTTTWIKLTDGYYYVSTATSSTYVYDSQKRLASQQTNGYRNDTDYGRSQSLRTYTYTYNPTQLTVLREGKHLSSSLYAYDTLPTRQYLSLNEQGLVTSQPQFDSRYGEGDNGYNGISQLFSTSLDARVKDTLRRYDSEGYLMEATTVPAQPVYGPWRLVQTIEAGNISGSYITRLATPTTTTETRTSRKLNLYDEAQANIPNPHQFLGSASRNLMVKTVYYPTDLVPTSQTYRYEYDQKGRVARYFISNSLGTGSSLYLIGQITYKDQ